MGKACQALHSRAPFGQLAVIFHKPGKRTLHLAKGATGLDKATKRQAPRKIGRRGDNNRKNGCHLPITCGEEGQALCRAHEVPPIQHQLAEALRQAALFIGLPTIKRDAFGILTQPHQRITEIRFQPLLGEIERDQRPADQMRKPGTQQRIDQRHPDHIARNFDTQHRNRPGQRPKHQDERPERDNGIEQANAKRKRVFHK